MILPRTPGDPVAVLVWDVEDARAVLRLLQVAADALARRSGGLQLDPSVADLYRDLQQAAANPCARPPVSDLGHAVTTFAHDGEVTTAEAAKRLGCSERTARRRCEMGTLRARRAGWFWLVDASSLPSAEDDDERRDDQAAEPVERDQGQERRGRGRG